MSSGLFIPGTVCCICFDGIEGDRPWRCPICGTRWDMCADCGDQEGCLTCKRMANP